MVREEGIMKLLARDDESKYCDLRIFDTETGIVYEMSEGGSKEPGPHVIVFHVANIESQYIIEYRGKTAQRFWDVIATDAINLDAGDGNA